MLKFHNTVLVMMRLKKCMIGKESIMHKNAHKDQDVKVALPVAKKLSTDLITATYHLFEKE